MSLREELGSLYRANPREALVVSAMLLGSSVGFGLLAYDSTGYYWAGVVGFILGPPLTFLLAL